MPRTPPDPRFSTLDAFCTDYREVVSVEAGIGKDYLTTVAEQYRDLQGEPYQSTVLVHYGVPQEIRDRWESYLWREHLRARRPPGWKPRGKRR